MKQYLLFIHGLFVSVAAMAQATVPRDTTINAMQYVTPANLDSTVCLDASPLSAANGTIWPASQVWRVRGVVTIPGTANVSSSTTNPNRQVWMRQIGGGPFGSVSFRFAGSSTPDDMYNLVPGDTVQVTGTVTEFNGETQMNPIARNGVEVLGLHSPRQPKPAAIAVNAGELNNASLRNQLSTGEQYEGEYIELRSMRVVAVSRYFASNANRIQFTLQDNAGNKVVVRDRFFALRLPNCSSVNPGLCGRFIPPSVGDVYNKIRGIVLHSKQPCTGAITGALNGYEIHPFDSADMEKGKSAPYVVSMFNSPFKPTSTQSTTITAEVTPGTDSIGRLAVLNRVVLYYDTASFNGSRALSFRDSVSMTYNAAANLYTADIPAFPSGTIVKYYIKAVNDQSLVIRFPDVNFAVTGAGAPLYTSPKGYTVGDSPICIKDLQFNPLTIASTTVYNMPSPAVGAIVSVSGYVTADTSINGAVFIQDTVTRDFNAIMVKSDNTNALNALRNGQYITVTGRVDEDRQITYIYASAINVSTRPRREVVPFNVNINDLYTTLATASASTSTSNWTLAKEGYESKLVRLINGAGTGLFVSEDTASVTFAVNKNNFSEWLLTGDTTTNSTGIIVVSGLAPRNSSVTTLTSKYNPYINYADTAAPANRFVKVPTIRISDARGAKTRFLSVTGIIAHSFNNLKIIPRTANDMWTSPTDVSAAIATKPVLVYPNPAKDLVNISFTEENASSHIIIITDLNGRIVSSVKAEGTTQVSTQGMATGIYIVSVGNAEGKMIHRQKLAVVR